MKIVLYVNSFLPLLGGREIVVHYLANEFQRMGHAVRVLGPSGWWRYRKLKFEYPVHRWPTLRGLFTESVHFCQAYTDTLLWGADIIHAHSTYPSGYTISRIKHLRNTPLIVTPHGEDIHVAPEIGFGLRLYPDLDQKIKRSMDRAQRVTAISQSVIESIQNAGIEARKIKLIPNGIDIDRFSKRIEGTRSWLNIDTEAPVILTVGRYHTRKGFDVLIQSMPAILRAIPKAVLVIVGDSKGKIEPLVRKLTLQDNVVLTGELPFPMPGQSSSNSDGGQDRLAGLYQTASLYVSAAMGEGAEGLSLAMLDGMAAGLPIVATEISGNKDLITPSENGLLVPPADSEALAAAIVTMLKDASLAIRCAQNNRCVAEDYSWSKVASEYLTLYERVLDGDLV